MSIFNDTKKAASCIHSSVAAASLPGDPEKFMAVYVCNKDAAGQIGKGNVAPCAGLCYAVPCGDFRAWTGHEAIAV
jgi:hypothetical protein